MAGPPLPLPLLRAGAQCNQVHADPLAVTELRGRGAHDCCLQHGDTAPPHVRSTEICYAVLWHYTVLVKTYVVPISQNICRFRKEMKGVLGET